LDAPEPPRIVLERPAPCRDRADAEEALRNALSASTAPGPAWTVKMRVERGERGGLRALGEITDPSGAAIAQRTLARGGDECTPLARGVGVWAALVLDAEVERARSAPASPAPSPPATPAPASPTPIESTWSEPPEKPSPEAQLFLSHPAAERDVELGAASYIMTGGGGAGGLVAGGSIFNVWEAGEAWFLRPSIGFGRSVNEVNRGSGVFAVTGALRFDACKRIPGNYLDRRGLQVDLCAGPAVGFQHENAQGGVSDTTVPFVSIGPSMDFRGELASALAVLIRGVVEVNVLHGIAGPDQSPGYLEARVEVGLSWRFR